LFTVALCTRGRRPKALSACLRSLARLKDLNYEVVCVDNSDIGLDQREILNLGARYVREARRGLDFARNRAVTEARGELIAFIDDDCEADPAWLDRLRKGFVHPEVACVTGRVVAASQLRREERWFEEICSFDRGPIAQRFEANGHGHVAPHEAARMGTGCNMAFRRDIFERLGYFDVALDMGTIVGGGGDLDMFARVLDAGNYAFYSPEAVVRHYHRSAPRLVYWQLLGYGVSAGALALKGALSHPRYIHRILLSQVEFARHVLRVGSRRIRRRSKQHLPVSLSLVMLVGDVLGPFVYVVSWLIARAARER
jgi:glycosyltransferase involved in cell wall biosynthesis